MAEGLCYTVVTLSFNCFTEVEFYASLYFRYSSSMSSEKALCPQNSILSNIEKNRHTSFLKAMRLLQETSLKSEALFLSL